MTVEGGDSIEGGGGGACRSCIKGGGALKEGGDSIEGGGGGACRSCIKGGGALKKGVTPLRAAVPYKAVP